MGLNRKHMSERGFSLVEIVISMAVLTITVGGMMMLISDGTTNNIFRGGILGTSACMKEAYRVLGAVEEKGIRRAVYTMNEVTIANAAVVSEIPLSPTPWVAHSIRRAHRRRPRRWEFPRPFVGSVIFLFLIFL
jgi:prepilin-type N-terminal cleavage/methylation domain-containing protein